MTDHVADDERTAGSGPDHVPGPAWSPPLTGRVRAVPLPAPAPGDRPDLLGPPETAGRKSFPAPRNEPRNETRADGPAAATGFGSGTARFNPPAGSAAYSPAVSPADPAPSAVPPSPAVPAPRAEPTTGGSGTAALGGGPAGTDALGRTTGPAPHPGRWVALAVLVLAVLLVALDSTVLGLAVPFLSEDLAPTGTQLLWIGDVYAFMLAGLLVTMGGLGDRLGRKKLLLIGAGAFGAISALAAYSPGPGWMIAARAAMGVAGAALMPSTLALIRNLFPDRRERSLAVGIWGAATSAGAAVGPVVGGFLLEHFWWGSVFLVNLPVMAVLLVVGARLLPESRNPAPGPWDLPSVALSLLGMVAVVFAVKETAAQGPGLDRTGILLLGAALLVWFVRRQRRLRAPLLDVALFRHRPFSGAVLANLMTVLGLAGLVFFLSQFLQLVQDRSPLAAGLAQLPAALGAVAAGLSAGLALRRLPVRVLVCGGLLAIGAALAGVVLIGPEAPYPFLGGVLLVCGLGAGFAYTVSSDVILSCAPKEQAGAASAVSETAYELGAALGIALLGSVVTGVYRHFAVPPGVSRRLADQARESLGGAAEAAQRLPHRLGGDLLESAHHTFVAGLRAACAGSAVLLVVAAGVSWVLLRDARST